MKMRWFAVGCVAVAVMQTAWAAERGWEVRGELDSLKPGAPEIVVLRLGDGRRVEIPLDALSESSQAAVRQEAAAMAADVIAESDAMTVPGPFGKAVRVNVPEAIKAVEADAIQCRTAADAADVYRLFLASERLIPEQKAAAEARLRDWTAQAEKGIVRLGDRWVSRDEAKAAADEAAKIVDHALDLMRLGNAELAEDELRKASRIDPESGRASFVTGLSYALVAKNPPKAVEHLLDASLRDRGNAAVLTDLAILEVLTRRYGGLAGHFRTALDHASDPIPVGDNVAWAVKLAGAAKVNPSLMRNKMPEKTVEELNLVYRTVTQELGLKPSETIVAPTYLGPRGFACTATTLADVAKEFAGSAASAATRRGLGFVVGPSHVVCPRMLLTAADGTRLPEVNIESPASRGRWMTATVIAAPEDGDVALLECQDLKAPPVTLAKAMPPVPEVSVIDRSGDSWLDCRIVTVPGKVVTPALQVQARGRFVHTAVVPRGIGGGPIVDSSGAVVGMVAATPRTDASGAVAGFGIPVERIRSILGDHAPADAAPSRDGGEVAGDRRTLDATVFIRATSARGGPAPPDTSRP